MLVLNSAKNCAFISIIGNAILFFIKFAAGIFGHSQALIADAIHSLSDVGYTIIVYLSLKVAAKGPDEDHPYGHGNAEVVSAIFVSLIMLSTGIYVGYTTINSFIEKHFIVPSQLALYVALFAIGIKEILFRYTLWVAERTNSPAVKASAYDHRSDVLSTVAALAGIIGAKLGFPFLDPLAGLIIAGMIIRIGIKIVIENVNIVMNKQPDAATMEKILHEVRAIHEIKHVSNIKVHPIGSYSIVDIAIEVDEHLTVREGHTIAHQLTQKLIDSHMNISDVNVHVEPFEDT
jgi:cation diffusion facilitator family transporter